MLAIRPIQFLWDEEKTRELFKRHIVLFLIGAILGAIYAAFLPRTNPYYWVVLGIPIVFILSCLFFIWVIKKANHLWTFLAFCLEGQLAASIFMAVTGGFLGIVQFAPYAFLIFAVFELGADAALILGIFSIITFLGILIWSLLTNPTPVIFLEFFYFVGSYILILILERNIGLELSIQLEARKKLEEVDNLKNQFITLASHFLRTPVTEIKGFLYQLGNRSLSIEQNQAVSRAVQGTQRLELIIDKLLTLSSIERGKLKLLKIPTDLNELIKQVITDNLNKANSLGIKITYQMNLNINPNIAIDRNKMKTVLSSIIDNAIIFNKKNGMIDILLTQEDNFLRIICKDSGVGIDQYKIENIFTSFNKGGMQHVLQLDNPGMGLSLYLSKLIVEAHGGTLTLKSEIGIGTEVILSLPNLKNS